MAKTFTGIYPFAYNNEYYLYVDQKKAEKEKFVPFMKQRNASYKTPAEEVYNNKKLEDDELIWESFRENVEPPTPQIQEIDGYEPENKE